MKKMFFHEELLLQNKIQGFSADTLSQILIRSKEISVDQSFPSFYKFLKRFLIRFENNNEDSLNTELIILDDIDENWLMKKAQQYSSKNTDLEARQVAEFLHEINSESKLISLFSSGK